MFIYIMILGVLSVVELHETEVFLGKDTRYKVLDSPHRQTEMTHRKVDCLVCLNFRKFSLKPSVSISYRKQNLIHSDVQLNSFYN